MVIIFTIIYLRRSFMTGDSGAPVLAVRNQSQSAANPLEGPNMRKRRPRPPGTVTQIAAQDSEAKIAMPAGSVMQKLKSDYLVGMVITQNAFDVKRAGLCVIQPTLAELERTQDVFYEVELYGVASKPQESLDDSGLGSSLLL